MIDRIQIRASLAACLAAYVVALLPAAAVAQGFSSLSSGGVPPQPPQSASPPVQPEPAPGSPAPAASPEVADKVVVAKRERRLYLLREDRVIAEYPVKLGLNPYGPKTKEGDFRTPEGVYTLTRRNSDSEFFRSIQVSYPNFADFARARAFGLEPGGLIMIHGQPNSPRKPADWYANNDWTDGCIAVSNADMIDIWQRTRPGTPVVIKP
jgi:murein L,D-transpeptidase YafK